MGEQLRRRLAATLIVVALTAAPAGAGYSTRRP
jgi:hypothetical protein